MHCTVCLACDRLTQLDVIVSKLHDIVIWKWITEYKLTGLGNLDAILKNQYPILF